MVYQHKTIHVINHTFLFQVLVIPIVLPIASLRTCISRQWCVPRYKQPIGELVMTTMICIIYLGTVVGVILPRLDTLINEKDDYVSWLSFFKEMLKCYSLLLIIFQIYRSVIFLPLIRLSFSVCVLVCVLVCLLYPFFGFQVLF